MKRKVAKIDISHLQLIRENVKLFLKTCAKKYDTKNKILLDIAPQDHEGASQFFIKSKIYTLDINPKGNATYTADICKNNSKLIPSDTLILLFAQRS
jgi:hypothetical protein